jgi:D-xylose transport system substrate-binding protein
MNSWTRPRSHLIRAGGAVLAVLVASGWSYSHAALASHPAAKMVSGFAGTLPQYTGGGKVGFSIYNGAVPHWNQHDIPDFQKCLQTYAPGTTLISADPKGDAATQTSQVQSMLAQSIKALILTPAALTPAAIINAAKRDNVPVIDYVNPVVGMKKGDVVALIGDGPQPIGHAQGEWLLKHVPAGSQIALINGDLATQYAQLMRQEQLKVLNPAIKAGKYTLVGDKGAANWDGTNAQNEMAAVLVSHPNVKAVIAGADFLAAGVINALKTVHKAKKVKIIGLDADPIGAQNILLGYQAATVIKSSDNEARVGCQALMYTLARLPIPKKFFPQTWSIKTAPIPFKDTPVKVVTKKNLSLAIKWGILTKQQMCQGLPASVGAPCG